MKTRLVWLTTERLLVAILFIAIFAMAVRVQADTDTWWHLASGRWMAEHGQVLKHDPFSHTMLGKPRIQHGWLVQIVMYTLYTVLGHTGLVLGVATVVTLTFAFVFPLGGGSPYLRAFTTVLAAITSAVVWVARPQIVSFLLAAVFAYLLDRYKRRGRAPLWLLPLLTVLWVNCHGGFITAFILMGGYIAGEGLNRLIGWRLPSIPPAGGGEASERQGGLSTRQIRTLVLVALICLAVVVINPQTYRMYTYPFQTVSIGVLRDFIQEWRSPDFHGLHLHPFIWMLLLTLAAMGLSGRRADLTDVGLVAGLAYMSLLAGRNIALFALIDGPILARYGAPALSRLAGVLSPLTVPLVSLILGLKDPGLWPRDPWSFGPRTKGKGLRTGPSKNTRARVRPPFSPRLALLNWALLGLVVVAALVKVAVPLLPAEREKEMAGFLPVEAVRFIQQEGLPGPMFNSYNWGGYLIWTFHSDYPVFVDGRTDLYDDPFLRNYLDVVLVRENWREVLARYGVRFILIERDSVLARFLAEDGGWQQCYADDLSIVFTRQ